MVQISGKPTGSSMVGEYYEFVATATAGTEPYAWSATGLPAGLQLDPATGRISGKVTQPGTPKVTLKVTDSTGDTFPLDFIIAVSQKLTILNDITPSSRAGDQPVIAELRVTGGNPPYTWGLAPGSAWPEGLSKPDGATNVITGTPARPGTTAISVQVTDVKSRVATADYCVRAYLPSGWRHPFRKVRGISDPSITRLLVTVGSPWRALLLHVTTWLAFLGIAAPAGATIWLAVYAFWTKGPHATYLGVGMLVSLAAFVGGCFVGFLFGIPRVVSSGQLRQTGAAVANDGSGGFGGATNLAEVSDWFTKLVLGAGLVELTRLGAPIGKLIDDIASGLYSSPASTGMVHEAKVMAGAILFGYAVMGLLDGYIVTTTWYQSKISRLAATS
jgi:Putative Ig domain